MAEDAGGGRAGSAPGWRDSVAELVPLEGYLAKKAQPMADLALEGIAFGDAVTERDVAITRRNVADTYAQFSGDIRDRMLDQTVDRRLVLTGAEQDLPPALGERDRDAVAQEVAARLAALQPGVVYTRELHHALVGGVAEGLVADGLRCAAVVADAIEALAKQKDEAPPTLTVEGKLTRSVILDDRQGRLTHEDMSSVTNALLDQKPSAVAVLADTQERAEDLRRALFVFRVCPDRNLFAHTPVTLRAMPEDKLSALVESVRTGRVSVIGRAADPVAATVATLEGAQAGRPARADHSGDAR